jgi:hypothetical protein
MRIFAPAILALAVISCFAEDSISGTVGWGDTTAELNDAFATWDDANGFHVYLFEEKLTDEQREQWQKRGRSNVIPSDYIASISFDIEKDKDPTPETVQSYLLYMDTPEKQYSLNKSIFTDRNMITSQFSDYAIDRERVSFTCKGESEMMDTTLTWDFTLDQALAPAATP